MKNLFETEDFKEIREIIRNTIIEASKSIPEDMYTIIKEATYYISKQIEDMIADEIKFDKIVEDWFENGIKKSIQSAPNQFVQLNAFARYRICLRSSILFLEIPVFLWSALKVYLRQLLLLL